MEHAKAMKITRRFRGGLERPARPAARPIQILLEIAVPSGTIEAKR